MLQKTGRSLKGLEGVEKLDLLNLITEQVKEKIKLRQRMMLTLSHLNAFLEFEGLHPGRDAKEAIESLLELRKRQLLRLGTYAAVGLEQPCKPGGSDDDFRYALMVIPGEDVRDCFADAFMLRSLGEAGGSTPASLETDASSKRQRSSTDDVDIAKGDERPATLPRLGEDPAPSEKTDAKGERCDAAKEDESKAPPSAEERRAEALEFLMATYRSKRQ
jgi:hypothetical protein